MLMGSGRLKHREVNLMVTKTPPKAFDQQAREKKAAYIEQKRSEDALQESEPNYRAIFNSVNDAIFIHNINTGDIIDVNLKMCEMWGYQPEELKGMDVGDISSGEPPYTQSGALRWMKKAVDEGPQVFEWLAKDKNGRLFWVEVNLKCVFLGGENRILAVVHDVSNRKKVMQELSQANKIAELRVNELSTLNRLAMAIGSTLDLQTILQTICEEMVQIFKVRNTGIGLLNRDRTMLTLVAFHTTRKEEEIDSIGIKIPLAENASTHYVLETGQPIVVPDAQNNPLTASAHGIFRGRGTQCIMIVPLLARGEVIGTIGMPTSEKGRVFTNAEVSLAQTIAGQIAAAIENARLYEKTEQARDIAERELEIGRQIQAGFLPDSLPSLPDWEIVAHFEPAHQVAGDFYDVFVLGNDGNVGLVIADVCDKGVGAALFMALFRSLIRAFAMEKYVKHFASRVPDLLPAEVLQQTIIQSNNYIATTHSSTNMFATLFFGILNTKTGMFNYINGGHEPPVIIGPNGIRAYLKTTGPALGVFPDMDFSHRQIWLKPGDTLLTYTDGVTDAQNQLGEFFTKNRFLELVSRPFPSAGSLLDHIRTEISQYISGSEKYDDITIMAVRRI